ncbi:MAG: roadblock/LC7 domain-containing protein [Gemmatimonadaceae bacterium]
MTNEYEAAVAQIVRQPGVVGAMLVGIEDGLAIAGADTLGSGWEPAAALASSVFRRTRDASADAGLGNAKFVRLEADRGYVCATSSGDIVIVAVTGMNINLGKLRLEMLSAAEQI